MKNPLLQDKDELVRPVMILVILFGGVFTKYRPATSPGRGLTTSTLQTVEHSFSRCIQKIMVKQRLPAVVPPTREEFYDLELGIAIDQSIAEGLAHELMDKYSVLRTKREKPLNSPYGVAYKTIPSEPSA